MTKSSDKKPDLSKFAKVKKDRATVDDQTFKKAMKKVLKENQAQLKRLADK